MIKAEQKTKAKQFAEFWKDKGYEKGESQSFWLSLLRDVYNVSNPEQYIIFESKLKIDHTSFIDGYIEATHVLIEQKGLNKDLNKPIKQSNGTVLTPFQQAKRYANELPYSQRPRWIITCNFSEFLIYDMEKPQNEPTQLLLKNLPEEYYLLNFLIDTQSIEIKRELEISLKAGELVGKLYDELQKQYIEPNSERTLKSLNVLCVRLVFCLYAESSGLFGSHNAFREYMKQFSAKRFRKGLIEFFEVLDTKTKYRNPYLEEDLAQFPYVNGGLFADKDIEIPKFSEECRKLLLDDMSESFNWSNISPTIFGAVFESTLNPEIRRSGGMHYTSIENIHKVIDVLFLNDLKIELEEILKTKYEKTKINKLKKFQLKLSSLTFLDPACGSGNFLTETYLSLRRLENEVIRIINQNQIVIDTGNIIKVSITQFYGIEINDFAVTVGKTALWIAEHQMLQETIAIVNTNIEFLPLRKYANIIEANALQVDWNDIVRKEQLNYIMGNPPFVGAMFMNNEQKIDMGYVFDKRTKHLGEFDYVSAWYKKAVDYMLGTNISTAFVSTNSICQGQQVALIWKPFIEKGIFINFAYTTFKWDNKTNLKAHVYCVIVGFSYINNSQKYIFENGRVKQVNIINPYLTEAPIVFVETHSKNLTQGIPSMNFGNMPRDGGGFILSNKEKDELLKKEPVSKKWIRLYLGAKEFINNTDRWCLWLEDANPSELKKCPLVLNRVDMVKKFRLNSCAKGTRELAQTPTLFAQITQPIGQPFILIPRVSSENRYYIPMGFCDDNVIASDAVQIIPNATTYHFGVLTSNVHMTWVKTVCGRLKNDYRYSKDIVYNNFPWCNPTEKQKELIEKTAQGILNARALYPDCSLADLYDELTMPFELRNAHKQNDKAVMEAYGFKKDIKENEIIIELMKMYQNLIEENNLSTK